MQDVDYFMDLECSDAVSNYTYDRCIGDIMLTDPNTMFGIWIVFVIVSLICIAVAVYKFRE